MKPRLVPTLAAVLLVIASGFKIWQLIAEPDPHLGTIPVSTWVLASLITGEVVLAWWLCVAHRHRLVLATAAALFTAFAAWTAWQTIRGDLSCGCFGPMQVPPMLMLAIDLLMAIGLWGGVRGSTFLRSRWWHWAGAVCLAGSIAGMAAWGRPRDADAPAATTTTSVAAHAPTPPGWRYRPGMSLGIADPQVRRGTWRVICYRYACPHCQAHLATWAYTAREAATAGEQWAFLWLDDPALSTDLLSDRMAGTLPRWQRTMPMMRTPALLTVIDGVVTAVTESMPDASMQ